MLLELEASILEQLRSALGVLPIQLKAFPENPADLGRPMPRGQVLVGYKRSTFRKTSDYPLTVEMLAEFEVTLQLNNLRTHTGAYPLLDLIRSALLGFMPLAGMVRPMYPTSEAFSDLDEGTWFYTSTFIAPLIIPGDYSPIEENWNPENLQITAGIWRSPVDELPDRTSAQLDRTFTIDGAS